MTTAKPWWAAQSLQPASSSSRELNSLGGMGARERGGGGEAPGEIGIRSRSGVPGRNTPNMFGGRIERCCLWKTRLMPILMLIICLS